MPTPSRYDALAARLHGRRKLTGLCFLASIVLTALCLVAFRARLLSPIPLLVGVVLLFFFTSGLSAGLYLVCEWFDPKEGSLHSLPKPSAKGRIGSVQRWIFSVVPWIGAIFLDVWFLGTAAITLRALYRTIT